MALAFCRFSMTPLPAVLSMVWGDFLAWSDEAGLMAKAERETPDG
ncbi:hypothetical protein [Notoacmeibacter ruber]|nr:hypothetical protein [Notoacmeibacter ruber]